MEQYNVVGMSCAACVARIEKAVLSVDGVTSCSVSLLTNSMGVEGVAKSEEIIKAVENAGYEAFKKGEKNTSDLYAETEETLKDRETPKLKRRLLTSVGFLIVLMYFSMGHMMWGWPLPSFFEGNHVAMGLFQLLLTVAIMVINQKFFISGFTSLVHGASNMDTLVALGATASFGYSVYALFAMTQAQLAGDTERVMYLMDQFYFESAAMILTLITVGKMLEAHSKGKTTDALKGLMKLAPKTAVIERNGCEAEVSVEEVVCGDIFIVKPGESIPVDGIIIDGNSAINESSLTGESIPVDKFEGDEVSAATINQSGYIKCKAVRVGQDTTLSQIIQMVSDAAATKAPIAKIADKVAGVFVPCVLGIALVTLIIWIMAGETVGTAINFAISVLVISCPCSLGLATPVAIMVGNGIGAKNGILFKTAAALEGTGRIQIVALDKTGTITKGEPQVTDICPANDINSEQLLKMAYALEAKSEHPLAKAIMNKAENDSIDLLETKDLEVIPGKGLMAKIDDKFIFGGNEAYIEGIVSIPSEIKEKAIYLSNEGKTPLYFANKNKLLGMIAVADVVKEDAKKTIKNLKNMGISVVMITGDNERTANAISKQVGVDKVVAGVLPGGKEDVIKKLQKYGKVAMVGDGINDAPALTRADIGIAIGSGTDVAIDAADVVIMNSQLQNVPAAVRLGKATLRNIHQNLFWAFFYNCVGIPVAAGVFYNILGLKLNPMLGALAMSLSSFCVISNALRLNVINIFEEKNKKIKNEIQSLILEEDVKDNLKMEDNKMKKTMKITGMMCPHCEAHVKEALESIDGVKEAVVSHESGTAVVELASDVADDVLRTAVEKEKYGVEEISCNE